MYEKLNYILIDVWFFWKFHLPYSSQKFRLFTKMPLIFFFSKMAFLLSQPHHLQLFTRLPLPSIHQPPWTTNLKLLMHLKSNYTHSFLFLMNEKQHLFHFLSIFIKKTKILILIFFLWFIEPFKLTILDRSLSFRFYVLGEDFCVLKKLSQ